MDAYTTSFEDVSRALERRASKAETVTYNDFAQEVGLPPENNFFTNSPLDHFFRQIDADDQMERRPHRTALVVLKSTGRPGPGFFKSFRSSRNIDASVNDEELWTAEVQQLAEYYRTSNTQLCIQISPSQKRRLEQLCSGNETSIAKLLERTLTKHIAHLEDLFASLEERRSQIPEQTISHEELFDRLRSKLEK